MNSVPIPPVRPARPGTLRPAYSLLELIAALSTSTLLLVSLSLTIVIAGRMTESMLPTAQTITGAEALYQLADELQDAVYIVAKDERLLEFAVADRTGNGIPDVVRYEWSGTPGDPLLRSWNNGPAQQLVRAVESLQFIFETKSTTEQLPATTAESAEAVLAAWEDGSNYGDANVTTSSWFGQYFTPDLPGDALNWRATKVELRVRQGGEAGTVNVQLRRTAGDRKPISAELADASLETTLLPTGYAWETFEMTGAEGLSPSEGLAVVVEAAEGSVDVQYQTSGVDAPPHAMVKTADAGAGWTVHPSESLRYRVWGHYATPDVQLDVERTYLTGVRMELRPSGSGSPRLRAAGPALNSPELLSGLWELDFTSNPLAVDVDHDGQGDWVDGSFDASHLVSGAWRVPQAYVGQLETRHEIPGGGPITVQLRCRATSVGGDGAVLEMNLDAGGSPARLRLCVSRTPYGTQIVRLYRNVTAWTEQLLAEEHELPLEFVDARLVIVPSSALVSLWVNEVPRGSFTYSSAGLASDKVFRLYPSGADAEFDYVSIRAGAG